MNNAQCPRLDPDAPVEEVSLHPLDFGSGARLLCIDVGGQRLLLDRKQAVVLLDSLPQAVAQMPVRL